MDGGIIQTVQSQTFCSLLVQSDQVADKMALYNDMIDVCHALFCIGSANSSKVIIMCDSCGRNSYVFLIR